MKYHRFGHYHNEINGFQTKDFFSFFIFDFPIFVIRQYKDNHDKKGWSAFCFSLLGFNWI
jgi:hypothetical protein